MCFAAGVWRRAFLKWRIFIISLAWHGSCSSSFTNNCCISSASCVHLYRLHVSGQYEPRDWDLINGVAMIIYLIPHTPMRRPCARWNIKLFLVAAVYVGCWICAIYWNVRLWSFKCSIKGEEVWQAVLEARRTCSVATFYSSRMVIVYRIY